MYCFKCGALQENLGRISFRGECSKCGADLHSCMNCKFYENGRANDCKIPGIDRVIDKLAANFCEEFSPSCEKKDVKLSDGKKRFDDLFK